MKWSGKYALRTMAGEHVLMPQGETLLGSTSPMVVNEVTADLLSAIIGGKSQEAIIEWVTAEYHVDAETAQTAYRYITDKLTENGVLLP